MKYLRKNDLLKSYFEDKEKIEDMSLIDRIVK